MPKAVFNGAVIAQSDDIVDVEGNKYFPADSIVPEYFVDSDQTTTCPWKGQASYKDVVVGGRTASGAAWCYSEPKPAAGEIAGRFAFWRGVEIVD